MRLSMPGGCDPVFDDPFEFFCRIADVRDRNDFQQTLLPLAATAFKSPSRMPLNGCFCLQS